MNSRSVLTAFIVPLAVSVLTTALTGANGAVAGLTEEPREIGSEPQFLFDLYVVDTTWGLKPKGEPVKRVLHQPGKHPANPTSQGKMLL